MKMHCYYKANGILRKCKIRHEKQDKKDAAKSSEGVIERHPLACGSFYQLRIIFEQASLCA